GRRRGRDHSGAGGRRMLITREELAAIKEQAAAEYPNECCGVILARGAERRHVPCRNVQDQMHARDPITFPRTARNAYYMDPIDALRLNRLADEGFAFAVIYHSHPNAGAYFSETDRGQALIKGEPAYPGAVYVVVSVVGREVKALAAYRWNAERRVFDRADAGDLDPAEPAVSRRLLAAAERRIPGGVNSPVRAFRSVGGEPRFVARAEGARLWDADGRAYLDFVGSWGPLVLGHAPRAVVEAVTAAAAGGTSYGAPTRQEVELAEAIATAYPSMELVRLVSSGTEAAMSAIRVARGAAGPGLPRRAARGHRAARGAPDLRRGDHGLPRRLRRRPGALRRAPRPHVPGQDHRRRTARGRLRRAARRDGPRGAARRRVPGGHAVGQPARGGGRARHPARARGPQGLRAARGARRPPGARAARRRRQGGHPVRAQPRRLHAHGLLLRGPRARLRGREDRRHRPLRALLSRDARSRRLSGAFPVRGGVRLARPRRGRSRSRRARRRRRDGRRRLTANSLDERRRLVYIFTSNPGRFPG